jgi:hypothetical protein
VIVVNLGEVDRVRDVLALGINADLALGALDADVALGDDLAQIVSLGRSLRAFHHSL